MGARSGNNYLSAIRKLKAECSIDGIRIIDQITHPALVKYARGIASLYDAQIERPAAMTYRLDDGDRAGLAFIQPRDAVELEKRATAFQLWAELRGASFDFAPEALNSALAAMAAASEFFAGSNQRLAENLQSFYRAARHHDWCMTSNRITFESENVAAPDEAQPLRIVERNDAGVRVSGTICVTTPGSLTEKLLVLPSPADVTAEIVFAIDCNAAGLGFEHRRRESLDQSGSEQLVCSAIFDRVAIPVERIFLRDDPERYRVMLEETGAAVMLMHQAAIQAWVRAEILARVAKSELISSSEAERWGETAEKLQECVKRGTTEAEPNRWGMFVPSRASLEKALRIFRL